MGGPILGQVFHIAKPSPTKNSIEERIPLDVVITESLHIDVTSGEIRFKTSPKYSDCT